MHPSSSLSALRLPAILTALISTCLLQAHAEAQGNPEGIAGLEAYLDPANTVLQAGEDHAAARLRLINHSATPLALRLEAGLLLLKGGTAVGRTVFPGNDNKDVVAGVRLGAVPVGTAGDSGSRTDMPVSFVGLSYLGVYAGSINIINENAPAQQIHLGMEVRRLAAGFTPTLRGSLIANGVLTAKPQSDQDKIFSFVVENPETGRDADFVVTIPIPPSGKNGPIGNITVSPDRFHLAPGGTEQVKLSLAEVPDHGQFNGTLFVRDANALGIQKDLPLVFQPSFVNWSTTGELIALVAAGTAFSILVGAAIPTIIARQTALKRLADLQTTIDTSAGSGRPVQVALSARRNRIGYLAHHIWWISPKATDELADISKQTDDLKINVDLIAEVTRLREQVRRSDHLPVSAVPLLEDLLDEVEKEVVAGDLKGAQTKRETAVTRINAASLVADTQKSLAAKIAELPDPTTAPDPVMRKRIQELKDKRNKLDGLVDEHEILALDRECYAAHLYLVSFVGEILKRRPEYAGMEPQLLQELADGVGGLWRAEDLVKSMEISVVPDDISKALPKDGDADGKILVAPVQPNAYELTEFCFSFHKPKLNDSPLIDNLDFLWTFGDETRPARSRRSLHYFRRQTASWWRTRSPYRVKVEIRNAGEPAATQSTDVTVQRPQSRVGKIFGVEVLNTAIVFLGATGIAYISNVAEVRPFESIQDYFNPFLWGFGLDQMKGLVTKLKAGT